MNTLVYLPIRAVLLVMVFSIALALLRRLSGKKADGLGWMPWGLLGVMLVGLVGEVVWRPVEGWAGWMLLVGWPLWWMPLAWLGASGPGWLGLSLLWRQHLPRFEKLRAQVENTNIPPGRLREAYEQLETWTHELDAMPTFAPFLTASEVKALRNKIEVRERALFPAYNLELARQNLADGHVLDAYRRLQRWNPDSIEVALLGMELGPELPGALRRLCDRAEPPAGMTARQRELLIQEGAQWLATQNWASASLRAQAIDTLTASAQRRRLAFLHHRHGESARGLDLLRDDPSAQFWLQDTSHS